VTSPAGHRDPLSEALERSLGALLITDADGKVLYGNEALARRTGFAVAEALGRKPGALWGGAMDRPFYDGLYRTLDGGGLFTATVKNERKDKRPYEEELFIAPLFEPRAKEPSFFISAQPFHLEADRRARFREDLIRALAGKERNDFARAFFSVLNRYFVGPTDESRLPRLPLSFIEEKLILPLKERFAAREEDRELVLLAQSDPLHFRRLYEKYAKLVRTYFRRHLSGDGEQADDLTQETFYRAFLYLPGFETRNASYGTYLIRVAHNLLINHYRKKKVLSFFDGVVPETAAITETPCCPAEDLLAGGAVSTAEAKMLRMKYVEGFAIQEIASILGKSENAVKLSLSRARKKLRRTLVY
jgi:RNA polymerase sigma-70 factor (ECF subfamily)